MSLILALIMALSLVACGGGSNTPNGDGSNAGDSTELVFAHIFATDSMEDKCAKMFAEKVTEYTNGAYTVTVYPAGQLGAMAEIIEQQQVGTATFQIISTTALSSISEYAAVDSWPYMFTNREEFEKAYASDAGKEWLAKVSEETGFTLLAHVQGYPPDLREFRCRDHRRSEGLQAARGRPSAGAGLLHLHGRCSHPHEHL